VLADHDVVGADDDRDEGRRPGVRGQGLERGQLTVEDVLDAGAVDAEVDEAVVPAAGDEPLAQLPDPAAVRSGRADALVIESPSATHSGPAPAAATRLWDSHHTAYGSTCSWTARTPGKAADRAESTGPRGRSLRLL